MKTIEELANLGAAASSGVSVAISTIAVCPHHGRFQYDRPAREAFARAVRDAALPELLAALERTLSIVESSNAGYGCPPWEKEIAEAKAALTKAGYEFP